VNAQRAVVLIETRDRGVEMVRILVLGGGIIGLSTAMMLARRGHDVTVFERDSKPLPASPEDAWQGWERRSVAQFRQPHYLQAPAIELLDSHLPDVKEALIHAGCITFDPLATMPPTITDRARREGDERFTTITGRRPTVEYAVASVAEKLLPIRRGVGVASLLTGPSTANGIPHVTGGKNEITKLDQEWTVNSDQILMRNGQ
jgi:2-polyprenyl-6-methoxyphenol hydroxylase-like FAD-dependent oxidoreductase